MLSLNPIVVPQNTDAVYALLTVMADPAKHKALLDTLTAERQAAADEQAKLALLQSERDKIAADRAAFEKDRATGLTELAARKAAAEAEWRQIEAVKAEHAANVEKLAADRAALNKSKQEHADALGEVVKLRKVLG